MKRVGYLYERMASPENCILAEKAMVKNKRSSNRRARKIANDPEKYGLALCEKLQAGRYQFHPSRESRLQESYKTKQRDLLVPCLEDQAAEQAWLLVAVPYIMKRNYYYNCASIPEAGQTRACNGLKKWLRRKDYKYGMTLDIRHFYQTLPHELVLAGLRRIFKDERFIGFAADCMASVSDTGVGIAIGHPISHWLANVALMELDHRIKREFPDVRYVRYMDDMAFLCSNKRHLKQACIMIRSYLGEWGMQLKKGWQVFRIRNRGLKFLSYRFFHGYTILRKPLMIRIARRIRRAQTRLSLKTAQSIMSYYGILKHCDSFNFMKARVWPYISFNTVRKEISRHAKDSHVCGAA